MAITVTYESGTRFDLTDGRHHVVADQPREDGGEDAGMSPVELFVGSLASCVAYFVLRFCRRHAIPVEGLKIEADWSYAERPHRVGAILLRVMMPGDLTSEQRERLLKVAQGCTIHESLEIRPAVSIALRTPSEVKAGA